MSKPRRLVDAMKAVQKLHTQLMNHREAGPFLEAVNWQELNLPDYPLLIKHPMDLGLIQRNLDGNRYPTPAEYARDVRLVWRNCMTYNKEGSGYYLLAQKLAKYFDDRFNKIKWTASDIALTRTPTLAEKRAFSQNVYHVGSTTLGHVLAVLDSQCPSSIRKINADDVEINIDSVDARTFWKVNDIVNQAMKAKDSGGGSADRGDVAASAPARKRARH